MSHTEYGPKNVAPVKNFPERKAGPRILKPQGNGAMVTFFVSQLEVS